MQNIKNSLKKLRTNRAFREAVREDDNSLPEDIEKKHQRYRDAVHDIVSYKGYEFPADTVNRRILEEIEDLDVHEEDIFLVSYPANGGHLLEDIVQLMVAKHLSKIKKTNDKDDQDETEKKSDENSNIDDSNRTATNVPVARLETSNVFGHIRWLKSLRPPRIISTSLPYDLLPQQMHTPTIGKLVYLARNSKDHLVAYYYHHRLKGIQLSLNDFVDLYLHGDLLYGNYFDHVLSYWQWSQLYPSNVLFMCYEELKIVTLTMAELMAKFFGLNLTEKEIEEILTERQGPINASAINSDDLRAEQDRAQAKRLNKFHNVLGDWNHYLDEEQCQRIDAEIRARFQSQNLFLAENAEDALARIEKYGRILAKEIVKEKNSGPETKSTQPPPLANLVGNIKDNNNINNWSSWINPKKSKKQFRKKLVLTKDEARFIRKKDKVVIIDDRENGNYYDNQEQSSSALWNCIKNFFCCCFGKRQEYDKI